ncbi:unnamed protein product [Phytophthora lilii]|uniref:Unnamed protein product n=1 Tax=Phytophthora lilii TaxID=2077276 RepID=A0A9W6U461_9STRA|nr:unnamed protein product [Phytophthora lilii]
MRRLSTTAAAAPARLSLTRLFQSQPIGAWPASTRAAATLADRLCVSPEELPELRSVLAVQNLVAKIPAQPAPRQADAYRQWIESYRRSNALEQQTQLDKDAFDAFVKQAQQYLQQQEDEAFHGCDKIGPMEDEQLSSPPAEAFVEAVKLKLSRHMCSQAAGSFELMDKDKDGGCCG